LSLSSPHATASQPTSVTVLLVFKKKGDAQLGNDGATTPDDRQPAAATRTRMLKPWPNPTLSTGRLEEARLEWLWYEMKSGRRTAALEYAVSDAEAAAVDVSLGYNRLDAHLVELGTRELARQNAMRCAKKQRNYDAALDLATTDEETCAVHAHRAARRVTPSYASRRIQSAWRDQLAHRRAAERAHELRRRRAILRLFAQSELLFVARLQGTVKRFLEMRARRQREYSAAVSLQACARGILARSERASALRCATMLQSCFRGVVARRARVMTLRDAVLLQSAARRCLARRRAEAERRARRATAEASLRNSAALSVQAAAHVMLALRRVGRIRADRALTNRALAEEKRRVQATIHLQATTRGSAARRRFLLAQQEKEAHARLMAALALPVFKRSRHWPHRWSEKVLQTTDRDMLWSRSSRVRAKIVTRSSRMHDSGCATGADGHGIQLRQIIRIETSASPSLQFSVILRGNKAIQFRASNEAARDSWVARLQQASHADMRRED